ncbi:MAG: rRNA adenine dimethyltransferase family protein [archaeon]
MPLFEELQRLMIQYHFRPDKKLSQFFCTNEALLHYLIKVAKVTKKDSVLEIGPGTGFLTKILLENSKSVVAIEHDSVMFDVLTNEFKEDIAKKKLILIQADALEIDFDKLGVNKIVSLPPYHISSKLIGKVAISKNLDRCVMVLDKGFVEKLTAFEGFLEYCALTAFITLNAKVELAEITVESQSFFPAPNCVSKIVDIEFNIKNNDERFFIFLKELFRHKNKDLRRALKQAHQFLVAEIGWSNIAQEKYDSVKLAGKKVYQLSPQQLLKCYEELSKIKN